MGRGKKNRANDRAKAKQEKVEQKQSQERVAKRSREFLGLISSGERPTVEQLVQFILAQKADGAAVSPEHEQLLQQLESGQAVGAVVPEQEPLGGERAAGASAAASSSTAAIMSSGVEPGAEPVEGCESAAESKDVSSEVAGGIDGDWDILDDAEAAEAAGWNLISGEERAIEVVPVGEEDALAQVVIASPARGNFR